MTDVVKSDLFVNRPLRWLLVSIAWFAAAAGLGSVALGSGLALLSAADELSGWAFNASVGAFVFAGCAGLVAALLALGLFAIPRDVVPSAIASEI